MKSAKILKLLSEMQPLLMQRFCEIYYSINDKVRTSPAFKNP